MQDRSSTDAHMKKSQNNSNYIVLFAILPMLTVMLDLIFSDTLHTQHYHYSSPQSLTLQKQTNTQQQHEHRPKGRPTLWRS